VAHIELLPPQRLHIMFRADCGNNGALIHCRQERNCTCTSL